MFNAVLKASFLLIVLSACLLCGCGLVRINIGSRTEEPLKEYTMEGKGKDKILVVSIRGFLSDMPSRGILGERPSIVQEVVAQLRKAEKDKRVKAVVLQVNSPGGSTTASDILYHEICVFKHKTGKKVVASFLDIAASGAYYLSLPSDKIIAHPTSVIGSVGVVMMTPKVRGLMDKVGVAVEVTKSGSEKDIGSPFRPSTPEETKIFQDLIDHLGKRFVNLVVLHRKTEEPDLAVISTARIFPADESLRLKLIDKIGYLDDAITEARTLASLPAGTRVVAYRRAKYGNDNVYNMPSSSSGGTHPVPTLDSRLLASFEARVTLPPGPYYLWLPGILGE
jgi:protease-4